MSRSDYLVVQSNGSDQVRVRNLGLDKCVLEILGLLGVVSNLADLGR